MGLAVGSMNTGVGKSAHWLIESHAATIPWQDSLENDVSKLWLDHIVPRRNPAIQSASNAALDNYLRQRSQTLAVVSVFFGLSLSSGALLAVRLVWRNNRWLSWQWSSMCPVTLWGLINAWRLYIRRSCCAADSVPELIDYFDIWWWRFLAAGVFGVRVWWAFLRSKRWSSSSCTVVRFGKRLLATFSGIQYASLMLSQLVRTIFIPSCLTVTVSTTSEWVAFLGIKPMCCRWR